MNSETRKSLDRQLSEVKQPLRGAIIELIDAATFVDSDLACETHSSLLTLHRGLNALWSSLRFDAKSR